MFLVGVSCHYVCVSVRLYCVAGGSVSVKLCECASEVSAGVLPEWLPVSLCVICNGFLLKLPLPLYILLF